MMESFFEIDESVSSVEINGSTGLKIAKYAIPEGEYLYLPEDAKYVFAYTKGDFTQQA